MYYPSQIQCVRVLEIISLFDKYISETRQCKQVNRKLSKMVFVARVTRRLCGIS